MKNKEAEAKAMALMRRGAGRLLLAVLTPALLSVDANAEVMAAEPTAGAVKAGHALAVAALPGSQEVFDVISKRFIELYGAPSGQEAMPRLTFGQAAPEIGTFDGWSLWLGWAGSFSDSYSPDSETYAWVTYLAPEGIFVALQWANSVYSSVDVFAALSYFYGALQSPAGDHVTKDYIESLLGVSMSVNSFDASAAAVGPLAGLSVALQSGQTFFRVGSSKILERGIQYNVGVSTSYSLLPFSLPFGVSLDTESGMETPGFYPIVLWDITPQPGDNPVDLVVAELAGLRSLDNTAGELARTLLPFMRDLPASADFDSFFGSSSSAIDGKISSAETWLQTGDTSNIPPAVQPTETPQELSRKMRPVYPATQLAFEMGYKHGYDASGRTDTIYGDCVATTFCRPGAACDITITTSQIAALVPGSRPASFEGATIYIDYPPESFLMEEYTEAAVTVSGDKAVFQLLQNTVQPVLLGARLPASTATGSKKVELCRQKAVYILPDVTANGGDGPLTVTPPESIDIAVALEGIGYSTASGDWWAVADTPFGWYHYDLGAGWQPGLASTYRGQVFDLDAFSLLHEASLPAGRYTFYFGVDLAPNGTIDMEQLYSDQVEITIQP